MSLRMIVGVVVGSVFAASCVDSPALDETASSVSLAQPTPTFCYPVENDDYERSYCAAEYIGCQNGWPIQVDSPLRWPKPCPFPEIGFECFCSYTDLHTGGNPQVCYDQYIACLTRIGWIHPTTPP